MNKVDGGVGVRFASRKDDALSEVKVSSTQQGIGIVQTCMLARDEMIHMALNPPFKGTGTGSPRKVNGRLE